MQRFLEAELAEREDESDEVSCPCGVAMSHPGAARPHFFTFVGRGTALKRSGTVLACFGTDFQAKPSILDPIRAIFDDLGPNRHFGRDLDLQDQARDWPGGPGPAHTFSLSRKKKRAGLFLFSAGGRLPPAENKKKRLFFFREKKKEWAGPWPPG